MKLFDPPPPTQWNVLNLGAGVQSSCLALMAAKGEVTPMPDFAVFADTQAEPQSVYDWLDWLEKQLPFPVYRVTKGNLEDDSLKPAVATARALHYDEGEEYMRRIIPVFGQLPNGTKTAAIGRSCTADYKIRVIEKKIIEKCGITRGQKDTTVTQWVGISWDEMQRAKNARLPWTQIRWPLIEKQMKRHACLQWMRDNGYPEPPRSACVWCPFHSDTEWRRLRDEEPMEFQRAVKFDRDVRELSRKDRAMNMTVYLHNSCKPLDEIDFDSDEQKGQQVWDFQSECEGMCGV
jgi:hypothetical protein